MPYKNICVYLKFYIKKRDYNFYARRVFLFLSKENVSPHAGKRVSTCWVLGGSLYAFRTHCETIRDGYALIILMVAASGKRKSILSTIFTVCFTCSFDIVIFRTYYLSTNHYSNASLNHTRLLSAVDR